MVCQRPSPRSSRGKASVASREESGDSCHWSHIRSFGSARYSMEKVTIIKEGVLPFVVLGQRAGALPLLPAQRYIIIPAEGTGKTIQARASQLEDLPLEHRSIIEAPSSPSLPLFFARQNER